jgi:NAD(P)-dependent dehydrogenase (short-subunit alcohol dehydrogenase family)
MTGIFTYKSFSLRDTPALDGKVAVVTGGQAGIGKEICTQLLFHGIEKIFILARSRTKFDAALEEWRERDGINLGLTSDNKDPVKLHFISCDLGDICAVREAADQIKQDTDRLDLVICNAGLGIAPQYSLSPQSIESVFATNCVGHHVLIMTLLPLMKTTTIKYSTDARVVVTSSSLHLMCRRLDLDLLTSPTRTKPSMYDGIWRYARSKLGNILFTRELSRRLLSDPDPGSKNIYVNSFFPGNIATEQMDSWQLYFGSLIGRMIKWFFSVFGQSLEDGAATALYLAASKEIVAGEGVRGQYFIPIAKTSRTSSISQDVQLAKDLWDWIDGQAEETLGGE